MSNGEELLAWQLTQAGILFKRQHRFHPERRWRLDFAVYSINGDLAVEVDGGVFSGGRHTRGAGYESDCEKMNEAVLAGYWPLRVTPKMVEDGRALAWIERAIGRKANP